MPVVRRRGWCRANPKHRPKHRRALQATRTTHAHTHTHTHTHHRAGTHRCTCEGLWRRTTGRTRTRSRRSSTRPPSPAASATTPPLLSSRSTPRAQPRQWREGGRGHVNGEGRLDGPRARASKGKSVARIGVRVRWLQRGCLFAGHDKVDAGRARGGAGWPCCY